MTYWGDAYEARQVECGTPMGNWYWVGHLTYWDGARHAMPVRHAELRGLYFEEEPAVAGAGDPGKGSGGGGGNGHRVSPREVQRRALNRLSRNGV